MMADVAGADVRGRARAAALTIAVIVSWISAVPAAQTSPEAEALYRHRDDLPSARRAAAIWGGEAPRSFDAAWRLARVAYWIGTHGTQPERRTALQAGVDAGEHAVRLQPNRPEGHFWLAADMGALAEGFGVMQALKYRGRIRDELTRVLAIDRAWQGGSADAALGQWYFEVPRLFGGSVANAEEHFRRALGYDAGNPAALSGLADVLIATGRRDEAARTLRRLIDEPVDPEWQPEDRDYKTRAAARLAALGR